MFVQGKLLFRVNFGPAHNRHYVTLYLNSKQNQLWNEGAAFYKGKPTNKTERHEFGIYSIKQREVTKPTPKGKNDIPTHIMIPPLECRTEKNTDENQTFHSRVQKTQ